VRLVAGLCLGLGIAKAGVGTECGLMAPESLVVSDSYYEKMRIPLVTQRMFKALMPVAGILGAIIVLNVAVLIGWLFFDRPIPNATPKPQGWGLHIGHLIAAPCLAVGSVLMIGCEIRSYGRVGLGYLTGMVGMIGFYFGYLPYVYFQRSIDAFIARHTFLRSTNWPELIGGSDVTMQHIVGIGYTLMLFAMLAVVIWFGSRRIGTTAREYALRNTDDLCMDGEADLR